jgi:RNA polymerase sigma-70 factor (ECF subfamily)
VSASLVAAVPATDRTLVLAIRTGGPVAAPMYAILRPSIERTLARVLRGRPQEFEDLLQITYERVLRTVASGNFEERSQLKTWAGAIAAHVATDYLRRKSYEARLFEGLGAASIDPPLHIGTPERQLEARSEIRKVRGILSRMKPRYASVLVLHDLLGHSVAQVAEQLGMNTCATRSTLRRARQEFAKRCSYTLRACDQGP